jgi:hypothetical protein
MDVVLNAPPTMEGDPKAEEEHRNQRSPMSKGWVESERETDKDEPLEEFPPSGRLNLERREHRGSQDDQKEKNAELKLDAHVDLAS